jgi:hypothetical protein
MRVSLTLSLVSRLIFCLDLNHHIISSKSLASENFRRRYTMEGMNDKLRFLVNHDFWSSAYGVLEANSDTHIHSTPLRLKGAGARRPIKGKTSGKSGALVTGKLGAVKTMGSAALAEYVKRKRDKQLRRNQRKHREEIIERRDEEKQLKKISDILWSAHLKDQVRIYRTESVVNWPRTISIGCSPYS